jgi:Tol biopolymer transport system component
LIATSQPQEIVETVERYKKDLSSTEGQYIDLVLYSGGAVSWTDIMQMPVSSIALMIERMNKKTEEQNAAMAKHRK